MADGQKTCKRCAVSKPVTEFDRHAGSKDGLRRVCRACLRDDTHAYRRTTLIGRGRD